jgi:hypothetical protein
MAGKYIPPAGWSEPDSRGNVTFTFVGPSHHEKHPEREGFECFFVACTPEYTRWTYRPVDTPTQQARLAVIELQRSLAMLDVGLNILRNLTVPTQAVFSTNEQAIAHVVNAKNTIADMQDTLLDSLPAAVREQVVRGSRIGADHLRNR